MTSSGKDTVLIGLVQINSAYDNSIYLPYSVGLLQAYAQKNLRHPERFQFLDPIFCRKPIRQIVDQLKDSDIVAFSAYLWNFNISLEIARRLKEDDPRRVIVFGGCNTPNESEEFLRAHPFVDIACHGEGEKTFVNILENLESRSWETVLSTSFIREGGYIKTPPAPRIDDMTRIPSPYLEGVFDHLMENNPEYSWMALWETNRGCPYTCAYCDWGALSKAKLSEFDIVRLHREIDWFASHRIEFVYCCDSNFGILERDVEIARAVVDAHTKFDFPKTFSVHDAKNASDRTYAIQKQLYDVGLSRGVSLALQSTNSETMRHIGRRNISLGSFFDLQKRFSREGIATYTDIIVGLPGETYDTFAKGISDIMEMGQHDRIRIGNLAILPNSEMGKKEYRERFGFVTKEIKNVGWHTTHSNPDDDVDETFQVVVGTSTMPMEEWVRTKVYAWWTLFLYSGRAAQIPILLLHNLCSFSFNDIFDAFINADRERYPVTAAITRYFTEQARKIQQGDVESHHSPEWLNLYWPQDEYTLIKLVHDGALPEFYREVGRILASLVKKSGKPAPFLDDAIMFNMSRMKRPFITEDATLHLGYNILEVYEAALTSKDEALVQGDHTYLIDRTSEQWPSWDNWLRKVIWYGNKKGAYLYPAKPLR